jgi:hypothetical protein
VVVVVIVDSREGAIISADPLLLNTPVFPQAILRRVIRQMRKTRKISVILPPRFILIRIHTSFLIRLPQFAVSQVRYLAAPDF